MDQALVTVFMTQRVTKLREAIRGPSPRRRCWLFTRGAPSSAADRIFRARLRLGITHHVSVRDVGRRQLAGPAFLHGRPDALRRCAAAFSAGHAYRGSLAARRHALPQYDERLARAPGPPPRAGDGGSAADLWRERAALVSSLASFLDGMRGALRLCEWAGMVRLFWVLREQYIVVWLARGDSAVIVGSMRATTCG